MTKEVALSAIRGLKDFDAEVFYQILHCSNRMTNKLDWLCCFDSNKKTADARILQSSEYSRNLNIKQEAELISFDVIADAIEYKYWVIINQVEQEQIATCSLDYWLKASSDGLFK
jgi:hypothetical protein